MISNLCASSEELIYYCLISFSFREGASPVPKHEEEHQARDKQAGVAVGATRGDHDPPPHVPSPRLPGGSDAGVQEMQPTVQRRLAVVCHLLSARNHSC